MFDVFVAYFAFPPLTALDLVGLIGVSLYVVAYSGVQLGQVNGNGLLYACLNGLAASCILVSMIGAFNLAGALVNLLFLSFSLVGVARMALRGMARRRRARADETQAALAAPVEALAAK